MNFYSIKLHKPKFWESKNNIFVFFLKPVSLLIKLFIFIRKKTAKNIKFKIPIICIGNIYIGGTGKTPSTIFLANELYKIGKNPAIVRKYYKDHSDEHQLINKYFKNVIINKNRTHAIYDAIEKGFDSVVLDDGFQDYNIKKDVNILCFNQNQKIGNGLIFPSGPLREDLSAILNAQIILINGNKDKIFEDRIKNINNNLDIFYTKYKPININEFKNKNLLAFAGIGNPDNFFELLEEHNLKILKKITYPDHYEYSHLEISTIVNKAKKEGFKLVTTEKDYYRIKKFKFDEIKYIRVELQVDQKDKLIEKILNKYVKNI